MFYSLFVTISLKCLGDWYYYTSEEETGLNLQLKNALRMYTSKNFKTCMINKQI